MTKGDGMSGTVKQSASKRATDRATREAVLWSVMAATVAAGFVAKKLLDIAGPGKALREQRERERAERESHEGDAP
jgi:hypothetical protein